MGTAFDQGQFDVRMEWGLRGAEAISPGADSVVIVDVLSFTTTVSVALDRGAEVFPYPWRDESARAFARRHRAVLAVGRSQAASATAAMAAGAAAANSSQAPQVSLSPVTVRAAPHLARIVLPSPNGSALSSQLAGSGSYVLAACLRNRTAVATWVVRQAGRPSTPRQLGQLGTRRQPSRRGQPSTPSRGSTPDAPGRPPIIAVIAAGERWPDGSLRPAAEDLWGAGALIATLVSMGMTSLSPEARSAAAAWRAIEATTGPGPALAACSSGTELAEAGFSSDVAIAAELDSSACVPLLSDGRFADVGLARDHGR
jgi:2-phosphosulfolactate phosphatase